MPGERYVLLGLAPARAGWFEALAQWTTSASIAAEFVKCVSAEEVRARLGSGRLHSALLVDASTPSLDRDLVDSCAARRTPVILVSDGRRAHVAATDIGITASLPDGFGPEDLVDVLATHCRPVGRATQLPPAFDDGQPGAFWQAPMFVVCGPGGTGASIVAIALASGLCRDPRLGGRVLLADLARRADQAMLHDSADLGPGLQELAEAHRLSRLDPEQVAAMTFHVPRRGYSLLLGLRRPEAWAAIRPRAVDAALSGLRRAFQAVVADVTGDFEGEAEGGSVEVEERNHLARAAAQQATAVVAVGAPGIKGIHSLAVLVRQLATAGVDPARIIPVVNRSPRNPLARAESSRALAQLLEPDHLVTALASAVHLPERKLEDLVRDGAPMPDALVDPLVAAVRAVADRLADAAPPDTGPDRVVPGSLATWAEDPELEA